MHLHLCSSSILLKQVFNDWTAANLGFFGCTIFCHFFPQLWRFAVPSSKHYTSRLDTYPSKRLLGILHFTKEIFSLQFVDVLCRRYEKYGFGWRYQGRGASFCFNGKGEEVEEQGEEMVVTAL